MAEAKEQGSRGAAANDSGRPYSLAGDSPELIAFALLRSVAQLEQKQAGERDRAWLLDAYAECLAAVTGKRELSRSAPKRQSKKK